MQTRRDLEPGGDAVSATISNMGDTMLPKELFQIKESKKTQKMK